MRLLTFDMSGSRKLAKRASGLLGVRAMEWFGVDPVRLPDRLNQSKNKRFEACDHEWLIRQHDAMKA